MSTLPLSNAIVLAALLWSAARIAVALVEGRTWARRCGGEGELLHHIDRVAVAVDDVRLAVEQLGDPHGGAR